MYFVDGSMLPKTKKSNLVSKKLNYVRTALVIDQSAVVLSRLNGLFLPSPGQRRDLPLNTLFKVNRQLENSV